MACFIVPAAEAVVVKVVEKVEEAFFGEIGRRYRYEQDGKKDHGCNAYFCSHACIRLRRRAYTRSDTESEGGTGGRSTGKVCEQHHDQQ